jgi:hypothetical protein
MLHCFVYDIVCIGFSVSNKNWNYMYGTFIIKYNRVYIHCVNYMYMQYVYLCQAPLHVIQTPRSDYPVDQNQSGPE